MNLQGGSWEKKYSNLILLPPAGLSAGLPLANQSPESKRDLGCILYGSTSRTDEGYRVALGGQMEAL